jgi:OFA family oxalate/formate antiporter-like MFS transporter
MDVTDIVNHMHSALARRLPFFYGWVIVIVSGLSGAFISGTTSWGLGIFATPMQEEFGWNRTFFFLPLAVGAVISAVAGPLIGPSFDKRYGVRIAFAIGVVLFAGSLIGMRSVNGFTYYLLVYGVLGGVGHFGLISTRSILPKWFIRKRGRAFATAGSLTSLGPLIFPVALQMMVSSIGWRDTWMVVGLAFLALMIPAAGLIIRGPEDLGLHPDGDSALPYSTPCINAEAGLTIEISYTRREAVRTLRFWLLIAAVVVGTVSIRGMIPNIYPFLVHQGQSATAASFSFTVYAISTIVAAFVWGTYADRHGARVPFLGLTVVMLTSMGFLWMVNSQPLMFAAMAYLGVGVNSFFIMGGLFVANSFGRAHYGAINGLFQPFNNTATYGGPLIFGILYDLSNNSYGALFTIAAVLWVIAFASAYLVRPGKLLVASGRSTR